jgi:hypothetical protein
MTNDSNDFIDYALERQEEGIDWRSIATGGVDPIQDWLELLDQIILLPSPDVQIPILTGYVWAPSTLANNFPIACFYGSSGAGKSETIKLIAELRQSQVNTAASTFASIRNSIEKARWYDSEKMFERNFVLLWDDINENVFLGSDQMFSLFKSGISRKSFITIADKSGVNLEFQPFSPKVVSSVQSFWDNPKLSELKRRMLPFLFKKVIQSESIEFQLLSVDEINFNGYFDTFEYFWRNEENRHYFRTAKKELARLKSNIIPIEISRLYIDTMATTSVCFNSSSKDTLLMYENYYQYITDNVFDTNIGISRIFYEWLDFQEAEFVELQDIRISNNFTLDIKPLDALNYLENCYSNGEISQKPDRGVVEGLFTSKGYIKRKTRLGYFWSKNLR